MKDRKLTIGLYLRNLDEEYQLSVYSAVRDEALARGIRLLCVQRDAFTNRPAPPAEIERNLPKLDGVLLLSSVFLAQSQGDIIPYLRERFGSIPCVSIGIRIFDFVSLIIRSKDSMERLVSHLVSGHGYRKILYLGGPPTHRDNTLREHVFRRTVNELLPGAPGLEGTVINGDFTEYSGNRIVGEYIEAHRDEPLDAIMAANDNMAIGALKALQTCPWESWNRCAVTGFDDIPQALLEKPSLTTVCQPLGLLGASSVGTLEGLIRGEPVSQVIHIDSSPVIRESCGCARNGASAGGPGRNGAVAAGEFERIQYQTVVSERYLRNIGLFGQEVSSVGSTGELCAHLGSYLSNFGVRSFTLIAFPDQTPSIPDRALLLYEKRGKDERIAPGRGDDVDLPGFFARLFENDGDAGAQSLYYLDSGELRLGLMLYDAEDFAHPYVCSMAIFIGNALRRLDLLEKEKERARHLEREVALRTADLVRTNRRLSAEASRRIKVEAEVLRISDMERLRFSLDLHDDICQRLAGISMYCKAFPAIPGDITDMIDETLALTRRYAHDSFPVELADLGLNEALRGLCAYVGQSMGGECAYRWDAGERSPLTRTGDINVYRIAQEALQNVAKHSGARRAEVTVQSDGRALTLRVTDDGKGNPAIATGRDGGGEWATGESPDVPAEGRASPGGKAPNGSEAPTGRQIRRMNRLGLTSMRYRAHQLGAGFSVESSPEGGTEVRIVIPLDKAPEGPLLDEVP